MYRKKKFLRKYSRGLSSPDKVYAFKRIAQKFTMYNVSNLGVGVWSADQPSVGGFPNSLQIGTKANPVNGSIYSVPLSLDFRLSDITQPTDFTTLFDQYKISGVKVKITWTSTQGEIGGGIPAPRLMYTVDEDDSGVPTEDSIRAKNSVKFHQFANGVPLVMYVKPRVARELYNNNLTTAYGPTRAWIDCSNPNVPHYGMKMWLDDVWIPDGSEYDQRNKFHIDLSYYIKTKGVQ